jgi:hypothetical protein
MSTTSSNPQEVEVPTPTPALTPEQVVAQLRALQAQIGEITPLTAEQRRILRQQSRMSEQVVQASLNVLGAADVITQAVGQPVDEVQSMIEEANRWSAVEGELRATLNGVAGTNLIRRQRIALVAVRAFLIGKQLARGPEHASLIPHLEEVKRLRSITRRKKRVATTPVPPAPGSQCPGGFRAGRNGDPGSSQAVAVW